MSVKFYPTRETKRCFEKHSLLGQVEDRDFYRHLLFSNGEEAVLHTLNATLRTSGSDSVTIQVWNEFLEYLAYEEQITVDAEPNPIPGWPNLQVGYKTTRAENPLDANGLVLPWKLGVETTVWWIRFDPMAGQNGAMVQEMRTTREIIDGPWGEP